MKSVVELVINAPQARVAELFSNPNTFPHWMHDIERIEPVTGDSWIESGPQFRLVPKTGRLVFVATVQKREPPYRSRLALRARTVSVSIQGTFVMLSENQTRLVSKETFHFRGILGRLSGFLRRRSIRRAHERHIASFKEFVENMGVKGLSSIPQDWVQRSS